MAKQKKKNSGCALLGKELGCCKVESLISVDKRGQMVLPKEIRDKAGIRPGDKLAIVSWGKEKTCCISLIKAESLAGMVEEMLGPIMGEILKK
ncbi:MAG: HgcAB-associated protein [Candidatus Ratteibacteria bacterium]|jgi:AbrB family looped-hinge helix DNA binding protein